MMRVYRWANTDPSTVPVQVFAGDPASQSAGLNFRWGDVLTARGSGTNTELFLNSFDGTLGAVLKPTDATLNTFTNYWFTDVAGGGSSGRSVEVGTSNTVFEKRKGTILVKSSYDLVSNAALAILSTPPSDTLGGVWVDTQHNIMAGVDFIGNNAGPDAVALYDITEPGSPMLLTRLNFQPSPNVANANVICTTILAGSRGWSLDANNGLVAFNINGPTLSIVQDGSKAILSWGLFAGYTLQATPSLTAPVTWTNVAPPAAIFTVNGKYTVTNSISGAGLYYRLVNELTTGARWGGERRVWGRPRACLFAERPAPRGRGRRSSLSPERVAQRGEELFPGFRGHRLLGFLVGLLHQLRR